jgi:3-hydroxyacyl-[acyl-carrier-protein] dehydratase
MSSASSTPSQPASGSKPAGGSRYLFDIDGIDLGNTLADRDEIGKLIPHRHEMALLDRIVWTGDKGLKGIAALQIKDDQFWVRGHFPSKPMFPGVMMVEAGAQLSVYLFNLRQDVPKLAAFLRIDDCAFRRSVTVGEEIILLCDVIKASSRRFVSNIQGIVDGQVCFEAKISGMQIADIEEPAGEQPIGQ